MRVRFYGTRGSIPVSRPDVVKTGGNTTCLRVFSDSLPKGTALVIDAGSGYVECSKDLLKEGVMSISLLFTHWHHDHTMGLPLAPHTFIQTAKIKIWGPKEHGIGPAQVFTTLMQAPFFPVEFPKLRHRFKLHDLEHVGNEVLVIHPVGGYNLLPVHIVNQARAEGRQISIGQKKYELKDCLLVWMYKTSHPDYSISFRFEELATGQIFVFLTDHEKTAALPADLKSHVKGAHLLVQDGQYSEETYNTRTAGFGHGTPVYCAETAVAAGVEQLGLFHHDPGASDADVEARLAEAKSKLVELGHPDLAERTFACRDNQEIEVKRAD